MHRAPFLRFFLAQGRETSALNQPSLGHCSLLVRPHQVDPL